MIRASADGPPPFEPFFLPAPDGCRFCIFHPPAGTPRAAALYVHPFAEEMNKSRRMAALQSRSLAAAGVAVLQIDLFGCGDSTGDFSDALWETWCRDVESGVHWLVERGHSRIALWGLRLGALLALDSATRHHLNPAMFLLWQPVTSGELMLTQFLRLRVAREMLAEGKARSGVQALREQLDSGTPMEIAGYMLTRPLAAALDALRLQAFLPQAGSVEWMEIVGEPNRDPPPAARRVADAWSANGIKAALRCVHGPSFWNTVEITECPELIAATTRLFEEKFG